METPYSNPRIPNTRNLESDSITFPDGSEFTTATKIQDDTTSVSVDGSVPKVDFTIGGGLSGQFLSNRLQVPEIRAPNSNGLKLYNDAGSDGLSVNDNGTSNFSKGISVLSGSTSNTTDDEYCLVANANNISGASCAKAPNGLQNNERFAINTVGDGDRRRAISINNLGKIAINSVDTDVDLHVRHATSNSAGEVALKLNTHGIGAGSGGGPYLRGYHITGNVFQNRAMLTTWRSGSSSQVPLYLGCKYKQHHKSI